MRVLDLLDDMIAEIDEGKRTLFSSRKTVDVDSLLTILQEIRAALPPEISQARHIIEQRDQIIAEAQSLASDMIEEAKQRIDDSAVNHQVVQQAFAKSDELITDAKRRAYELRVNANDYALSVLDDLASYIKEYSRIVEENRTVFLNKIHRQNVDLEG